MTEEQQTLLVIKGAISDLTLEQQVRVKSCYSSIKELLQLYPLEAGMAIAQIGAELAAEG